MAERYSDGEKREQAAAAYRAADQERDEAYEKRRREQADRDAALWQEYYAQGNQ
ncbi:hypothetical protein [Streptomyces sp. HUAS TT20]|uniref:hypothetical protein n=1 Tax=Streptomyces sp. HUAS TT20 TaxID=3447509 RepID=UPI0021DA9211|nr:hypothetical protein [Streptomyces sp. HUAS 15-9]UXY29462.1 hypothetical protein N8I87_24810 [Streptomyces sp. HUAS 15-9]